MKKMTLANKHYYEIDIMKGVAMLLAVLGHSLPDASKDFWIAGQLSFSEFLYYWIYSFHMAVFFWCAGFLFIPRIRMTETISSVFFKRVKRLIIPYFFYSLSYLVMKSLFVSFADHPLGEDAFVMVFFGVSPSYGCWFLWVLFVISSLFLILRKVNVKWLVALSLGMFVIAVYSNKVYLIGHIGDVMKNSLWFALGGVFACNYTKLKILMRSQWIGIIAFVLLFFLQFLYFEKSIGLLLMMTKTICGIEMVYALSCFLAEKCKGSLVYKGAKMIGDYCMDIYLLSMFVLVPMRILYVNFGLMFIINYYLYVLISVIMGIVLPYYVSKYIIRKNKTLSLLLIGINK